MLKRCRGPVPGQRAAAAELSCRAVRYAAACLLCAGRLQDLLGQLHENVRRSFIPRKDDVTDDYWEWLRWRLGQVSGHPPLAAEQTGLLPPAAEVVS